MHPNQYCWILKVVSNETNTDVRMYNLFIRWSALLDVQVGTEDIEGNYIGFLYNRNKGREHVRIALRTQLTLED